MITFSDNIARKPYLGSTEIAQAWLGNILVYPDKNEYYDQYLTFDILENGNIGFTMSTNTLQYSVDDGTTWSTANPDTNIPVSNGDKVFVKFTNPVLYKENNTFTTTNGVCKFYTDCSFNVYGNIMSLIYGDDFNDNQKMSILPVMQDNYGNTVNMNHFINLFFGCNKLISAENLVLPATILKDECYGGMFQNCTSLTTAPKILPAASITAYSYSHMFYGCTSLTTAPVLSGTVMGTGCYQNMFEGCTSLVTPPELPAKSLAIDCYDHMFYGCTKLNTTPSVLPATTLAESCYRYMFGGCTNLTTAPASLPATTLVKSCYSCMFYQCSKLVTAPVLPARILMNSCYSSMFYHCTRLNYIKALFTTTPNSTYTSSWVNGVASSGTFVKYTSATWSVSGENGSPRGWTIERASS